MTKRFSIFVLAVAGVFAVPASSAAAATYYASPASTLASPCSAASPCRLDHAVTAANTAGDVVIVLPGSYTVSYPVQSDKAITIEGEPGQPRPSLVSTASLGSDTVKLTGGATVRHLDIEMSSKKSKLAALNMVGGLAEDLSLLAGSSDNQGDAIIVTPTTAGTTVRTVLARSQAPGGAAVSFVGGSSGSAASLYNLTAVGESPTTVAMTSSTPNGTLLAEDSILSGQGGDISTTGDASINVVSSDFSPASSTGYVDQGGNISDAPQFANAGGEDFHEAPNSPTIDAGALDSALSATDLDGNARIFGATVDMGAYEYIPGLVTTTTTVVNTATTNSGGPGHSSSHGDDGEGSDGKSHGGDGSQAEHRAHKPIKLPPASAPVLGTSVTLRPVSGVVWVELPHSNSFEPLDGAGQVPVGAVVDATQGSIALTSATSYSGAVKTGDFSGATFLVAQPARAAGRTYLQLKGGSFAVCRRSSGVLHGVMAHAASRPSKHKHHVVRQLWGHDNGGSFVTVGRWASATVRGTVWLTQDRCDGTLIRVKRGHVLVRIGSRHRHVLLGPGQSYLARGRT